MHRNAKRIYCLLLACLMIFTLVPASVFAEAGSQLPAQEESESGDQLPVQQESTKDDQLLAHEDGAETSGSGLDTVKPEEDGSQDPQGPQESQEFLGKPPKLTYTVTFETNDGTPKTWTVNVDKNSTVGKPDDPTKKGFTFGGWYTDNNTFENAWDFNETLDDQNVGNDKTLTLYAKWVKTYTVAFNTQGGSKVNDIKVDEGKPIPRPDDPTRDGFRFAGWYKENKCVIAWDFTETLNDQNVGKDKTLTLYAKWVETYTVTFNTNKDTPETWTVNVDKNTTVGKPDDPTKIGHTFEGWFYYGKGNKYIEWNFGNEVTKDLTLYAKWEPIPTTTYTVTFIDGDHTWTVTVNSEEKIDEPSPAPTKEGHTFEGWFEKDSTQPWDFDTLVTGNITLYAKWEPIPTTTYTVTFIDGDHTWTVTVNSEEKIDEPSPAPTKEGHTFEGWFEKDSTQPWDFDTLVTGNVTLYAKWEAKFYTVKFHSKNGTSVADASVKHGETVTKPTNPTRSGYSFGGWYKDEKYTNAWSFNTPITSDITLYARWYSNSSSVPLYYNYVYVTPTTDVLVIPKTGGMVSLLPYALLSASALCAVLLRKRKED